MYEYDNDLQRIIDRLDTIIDLLTRLLKENDDDGASD